ncbi:MAG: hypothetical protein EA376_12090 [Phycisphaeraceae bacterium]|nr:MAG: hypothetical protein EA376_12090 [Phycisphaeraceae bacterium]
MPVFTLNLNPVDGPDYALTPRSGRDGESFAHISHTNPLATDPATVADAILAALTKPKTTSPPRIIAWSGTLADSLFERDPRSWLPPARRAFADLCDALAPRLDAAGATLLFRPCSRHVLADPTTCLSFLRERAAEPFGIVLDPIGFLEPDMLDRVEEHLERAFEIMGEPAAAVLLAGGAVDELQHRVTHTPLGAGAIPTELILDPWRRHCPAATPVILPDAPDIEARIDLVEAAR